MNKITILLFVLCFSNTALLAQEDQTIPNRAISLQEAIKIALENNHDISVANRTVKIAENNASLGNAGFLPTVTASGSYTGSVQDTEIRFPGNQGDINVSDAGSTSLSGSIAANYVLFDGFGNYYTFKNLQNLAEQSGVSARLQIEGTLIQVINQYLNVLFENESLRIAEESIERSKDRFNRVSERFNFGNASRLDVLTAQVDLNADSVIYVQSKARLENAKRTLLIQLGASPSSDISLADEYSINTSMKLDEVLAQSRQHNAAIVISRLASESAELQLRQTKSDRFPVVSLSGAYNYTKNEQDAGQFEYQELKGFNGGISVSLNLFNGFRRETQIQNAMVSLKNNQELLQLAGKALERDVMNLYQDYQTNLFLVEKEELNLETAELNFERSQELFDLGQITNTQFREAQLGVSRVQQNIVRLKVQAKRAEVQLLQLSGQLINVQP
ncbi:MAG: TolC family protein [Balneolaceae bacterium]|nr:TolC family protein [Balneolaceae bacterium]